MNIIERGRAFVQGLRALAGGAAWEHVAAPHRGTATVVAGAAGALAPLATAGRPAGGRRAPLLEREHRAPLAGPGGAHGAAAGGGATGGRPHQRATRDGRLMGAATGRDQ